MGFRERDRYEKVLSRKDGVLLVKRVFSKEGERLKVGFNNIVVDWGQEH